MSNRSFRTADEQKFAVKITSDNNRCANRDFFSDQVPLSTIPRSLIIRKVDKNVDYIVAMIIIIIIIICELKFTYPSLHRSAVRDVQLLL